MPAVPDEVPSPDQLLRCLRGTGGDEHSAAELLQGLRGRLAGVTAPSQLEWYAALSDEFARGSGRYGIELALLAAELHLWKLSGDWLLALMPGADARQFRSLCFRLGIALWHTGEHGKAETQLRRLPATDAVRPRLARLADWQTHCVAQVGAQYLQLPVFAPWVTRCGGVRLKASPLGVHHALALYRLQRNATLARWAGVERLTSISQAESWIREHTASKLILAVIHPEFGLIGIAALSRVTAGEAKCGSARFYFWIGSGYQGQGYGTQALALLRHAARHQGVEHLFSAIHDRNTASRGAVWKLGGSRILFPPEPAPERHSFYHYGCNADQELMCRELGLLLAHGAAAAPDARQA